MTDLEAKGLFDNILAKAEEKKIPIWTHLDLSYRCNLDCIHCYCQRLQGELWNNQLELSLYEIQRLLDELAQIGSLYLTLSGGEVLMRQDFFEIALYAKKRNFCLTIFTNGTLIDEDVAQHLAELSPLSIELSIYGVTADVHDTITQRQGSFQKLLEAVNLLKKHNLKVVLKSTIMKLNLHQANEIAKFSSKAGADDYHFTTEVSPKNDGSRFPQKYQLDEEGMYDLFVKKENLQIEKHRYWDNPLKKPLCGTGSIGCYISPYGYVFPCIQFLIPMGNIREKSFRDIWYAPSILRSQLDLLKTYEDLPLCRTCQYIRFCKKCIGLAYLEKKDIQACYDTLRRISKTVYKLSLEEEGKYA